VQDFYPFFYICIAIGDPIIKRGFGIPLTSLTLPHLCASPQPGQRYIVWYFCVSMSLCER